MLYSVSDLQGYTIHATDGDIGTLHTFYFGEEEWGVSYFVIDTGTWIFTRTIGIAASTPHKIHVAIRCKTICLP
jgi:hypothetical protein